MTETTDAEAPAKTATRKAADKRSLIQRLLAIAAEVGVLEPEKKGGVPFAFRGVDAVVATLTPLLIKHEVLVVPVNAIQNLHQRDAASKVLTKADLHVTYRFYGPDGDFLEATVPGQADDFADRSSAQAMSVAFRILLLQTFHIAAFGNEEQFSEDTKNAASSGGSLGSNPKVEAAKAKSQGPDPAEQMRSAIVAAAGAKGWEGDKINEFAKEVTGKDVDDWWDDPALLNTILTKINGG